MVRTIIDGQKAGEGSAKQPEIAPDSARSVTKLKQVIGLTEGEIKGFSKDDIKLDGTPLSALSSEIICDYRFGTVGQEYIPGVEEVANEIGVGVELRGDLDWVKLITNTDIDHVGVRLRWGPLQTSHTNGDVTGVFIQYNVQIAPVNGIYETVLEASISDKTSDSYERYHEFKLPPSTEGWMLKVVRVTQAAQSTLISDKMYVQAYAEIIKSKFTFPYTALIYLEYDARSFANVAKVAVNAKGMIIKVPSNYDPETREYTGLWNGTFKMAYSNNPAWVYFDIVTQPRYGCGDRIDQSMVDKWSLYRLGQYCDQMVDDGYGGLEPRFTCNVYLQSKERAYDVLNRLTGLFRAFNFWNGSQLIVDADIPQDTSYLYTNANVVDGLFEYAGTAATDLYSAAKVAWDNPANGFNTEYEAVSYEHLIKKLGFKTLELDAWGCTSRGQALRAGRWALLAESDTVTFKVGMDGYLAMPGKIIEIQDEFYAGKSNGGRVISISSSGLEITLDRPVETIAGDTISFNTLAGTVKKYNIASSNGSVVTLTESVGDTIERMHIWAISSSQLATQKYRILTVKYDGIGEFTISAVEYNASKYEDIDSNITFDEPPTSIINPIAQVAVKNVTISSNEYVYQGLNTVNLEIKWERAENAVEYLVELKKDDTTWLKLPPTGNNSIVLENVYAGYYIAKVTAVSAYELKSLPAYSVKTNVLGKQSMPLPPLNPRVLPIQFGVEFYWDFPQGATDTAVSRIVVAYLDPTGAVDDSGFLTYDKAYSDNKIVIQNLDLHTRVWFKVKLVDKLGFESPYTNWVSGVPSQDIDKIMDIISGQIEQSDLYDDLSQKIEVGFAASEAAAEAKAAADGVLAKVNIEIIPQLTNLSDGLTQEITDRQDGDNSVLGSLNAYKIVNDNAVIAAMNQANVATNASGVNASNIAAMQGQLTNLGQDISQKADVSVVDAIQIELTNLDGTVYSNTNAILALQGRTTQVEQGLATKLESSALENYYTTQQADQATSGMLQEFKSSMSIGGVNVLFNSEAPRSGVNEYLMYEQSVALKNFYDQNLHKDITISCEMLVPVAGIVVIYSSNNSAHNFTYNTEVPANIWTRVVATVKPVPHDTNPNSDVSTLEFYGEYGTGRIITVRNVQVEAGNFATAWSPSPRDYANEFDLAAEARANMYTKTEADTVTAGFIQEFNANLKIGGTNIYSSGTVLDAYGVNVQTRHNNSQGNYLVFGTHNTDSRTLRFNDVVTEMGWYTVSGLVRGDQGISARFAIDFCDQGWTEIVTRDDNNDSYFEVSVNVQDTTHRFMDIQPLQWLNYIFTKIKIEKGNKATAWSPPPYDTADAAALNQTQATVSTMNGRLDSTVTQVTNLEVKINSRNGFYLYSGGLEATTGGMGFIRTLNDNSWRYDVGRSYGLIVFRPNTGYVDSATTFDIYADNETGSVVNFGAAVEAIPNGWYAAVITSDEPKNNAYALKPYLKMLGGTDAIDGMVWRGAYMLIGQKGMSQGQALEMVSSDKFIGIQYILEFAAGVPVGLGGSSPSAVVNQWTRAEVQELDGQVTSLAVQTSTLSTTVGNNTAAIQLQQSSIDGINAKATLQVEAGGTIGGVALGNNGGVVDFIIRSNTFAITTPEGIPNDTKYMMTYQANDQTLPNGTVIPKGLKVNDAIIGTINANKIYAETISAISANLGTFTTSNANGTMIVSGPKIEMKYPNGIVGVFIGIE